LASSAALFCLFEEIGRGSFGGMRVEAVNSLGVAAAAIDVPWKGAGGDAYVNLREHPDAVARIAAASEHMPLSGFLRLVNGEGSLFRTVRAKVWAEGPSSGGEECAFHSRVSMIFTRDEFNFVPERYEDVVRRLVELWMKDFASADTLAVCLEMVPCQFAAQDRLGIALRVILTARGATPEQAQTRWGLGLARVQQAILFVSRAMRQKLGLEE
jgi:hypothetical protein